MLLFEGYNKAYGTYSSDLVDQGGGKMKGKAQTLKGEVTTQLWIGHLIGKQGIGIIPIDDTSRVKFAAIDIDEYPLDLEKLNSQVQSLKLPLVLCRTKSGGAHLYLFLETFEDAGIVQNIMREMAALLGYGNAEVFPKQTKIIAARGDAGSWINMPYFNSANTNRYALDNLGIQLGFIKFVEYAKCAMTTVKKVREALTGATEPIDQGPPCLNHLVSMGFPQGTRNNGLFNLTVYARKAHADNWKTVVQDYNLRYMNPPLEAGEVQGLIKSLEKKNFEYTCKQAPLCNYCNMPKCRGRKFGIGGGTAGLPKLGSLTKIKTVPPVWFLEVDGGGRLELTTDDLQSPRNFQNKCMATLNIMPMLPKMDTWQELIHNLLQECTEVEVPVEATPAGQLWQHLEDFCTSRAQARNANEMLLGKPWFHMGHYYFRLKDFIAYLNRQKFFMEDSHITVHFTEWKIGKKFWNLGGKGTNTHLVDAKRFEKQEEQFAPIEIVNPETKLT